MKGGRLLGSSILENRKALGVGEMQKRVSADS